MGYEDRDYMRVTGSGHGEKRGSNPLWWILALIALVMIVGIMRRGAMPERVPGSVEELVATTGAVQVCEAEFAPQRETARAVLPVLKSFFHSRLYDSTIHEAADEATITAQFVRADSQSERLFPSISYRWIGPDHERLKPQHLLTIQAYHLGVSDPGPLLDDLTTIAGDLRLELEQEVPGSVLRFSDQPEAIDAEELDW